uniref:Macaca fascicularis brain cDNA clone: QflA-22978, similar to human solute carrier family 35, member F1 (SLC35F1), mRNA, RefSeq: XM_167044.4 n=1 Tax=Macaca fascicularis TaxID=9541 RepID=I7GMN1_MACFA|nr:unnamed protein product [Macaca fascicularis]
MKFNVKGKRYCDTKTLMHLSVFFFRMSMFGLFKIYIIPPRKS